MHSVTDGPTNRQSDSLSRVHATKNCLFEKNFIFLFSRSKKNLHNHLQTHTNERKFICPTCKKGFKTMNNLKQHKHSHGPPQYACKVCGHTFSFSQGLLNHVRAIHGLKQQAPKAQDSSPSEEKME